jgi:hypothetical protein
MTDKQCGKVAQIASLRWVDHWWWFYCLFLGMLEVLMEFFSLDSWGTAVIFEHTHKHTLTSPHVHNAHSMRMLDLATIHTTRPSRDRRSPMEFRRRRGTSQYHCVFTCISRTCKIIFEEEISRVENHWAEQGSNSGPVASTPGELTIQAKAQSLVLTLRNTQNATKFWWRPNDDQFSIYITSYELKKLLSTTFLLLPV